jgi:hypothetical protein
VVAFDGTENDELFFCRHLVRIVVNSGASGKFEDLTFRDVYPIAFKAPWVDSSLVWL